MQTPNIVTTKLCYHLNSTLTPTCPQQRFQKWVDKQDPDWLEELDKLYKCPDVLVPGEGQDGSPQCSNGLWGEPRGAIQSSWAYYGA